MSLILYSHPFASYCQKVLIALYETGTAFTAQLVDLGDAAQRDAFHALWPVGKMPVLHDIARDRVIPESSIVIEYLDRHYPGPAALIPADSALALAVRATDRFYDLHVQDPMQKIVLDRLRAEGEDDPTGVAEAHIRLRTAYGIIDREMAGRHWAVGADFTLADCAAAPALYYADLVSPLRPDFPRAAAYFERLKPARPSPASWPRRSRSATSFRSPAPLHRENSPAVQSGSYS